MEKTSELRRERDSLIRQEAQLQGSLRAATNLRQRVQPDVAPVEPNSEQRLGVPRSASAPAFLALADELSLGTIARIMGMSDADAAAAVLSDSLKLPQG